MSESHTPSLPMSDSDSESTSSEEDSSSEDDGAPEVEDHGESRNVSRKERVDPLYKRVWAEAGRGNIDLPSERDLVRRIPTPMLLTTAEQRTRENMFGGTTAGYEQITIEDPVLYVALCSTGKEPSEVDDYHWFLIIGPSHEGADSKGTQGSMEPFGRLEYVCRKYREWQWRWLYNQRTIPLRSQRDLLARLMVAEVADLELLQAVVLRWALCVCMHAHPEWMSVKWVKNILKDLEEEQGCLGRRMESFESVEAKGRWLAKIEEHKRKGFSLLDTRVSTRVLFEREGAATSSTATVDIAIKYPVLYIGIYAKARSPHDKEEVHWAFLIGPSNDRAESEGVRCGIDFHLDSNGRRTWSYNQTIIPLTREPGLLLRMLLADIVDLRPLGEILRDHDSTPTAERPGSMGEASEWTSLAWMQEKLEMLERKPECFAYNCCNFRPDEWMGRKAAEWWEKRQSWDKRRIEKGVPPLHQYTRMCLVPDWKPPDDDEVKVDVKLDLTRGRQNTISRAVQIVTGALGADALKMRRQLVERQKQEIRVKQEVEERTRSEQSENTTTLAKERKPQGVDDGKQNVKNVEEQMMMARRERARNTTVNSPKLMKLTRAFEENPVAKKNEENGDQTDDDEGDDEDEDEDEDEEDDEQEEGKAKGNITQEKVNGRPNDVRKTAIHFLLPNEPDKAIERKNKENQKDEDSSDSEEENEDDSNEDDDKDNDNKEDDDKKDEGEDNDSDSYNSEDDGSNKAEDEKPDKEEEQEGEDSEDEDEEDEGNDEWDNEGEYEDGEKPDKGDEEDEDEDKHEEDKDEDEDDDDEDEDESAGLEISMRNIPKMSLSR